MVKAAAADPNKKGGILGCGDHHCVVDECEVYEKLDSNGNTQVFAKLRCLASSDPAAVGLTRHEYLPVSGPGNYKWWNFTNAIGLTTKEQQDAAWKSGEDVEVNEADAVGCQLCVRMEMGKAGESKDGKKYEARPETNGRFYSVFDPAVKDWPKDAASMAILTPPAAVNGGGNGNGGTNHTQQPVGAGAVAGGGDEFSEF